MTIPDSLQHSIREAISHHQLPDSFINVVETWFWPLAQRLINAHATAGRSITIGINGSQGSGKSTLADFLAVIFGSMNLKCAVLSIDDLYLTKTQRQNLAETIHPLFATRGVPGTHDVALGIQTIEQLLTADSEAITPLPRFNKAIDDRYPETEWPRLEGRPDIIILEGWCVGAKAQPSSALSDPINSLEEQEDPDGVWRHYANDALMNDYQKLFGMLDWKIMLAAPSFDCVYQWRKEQEEKLAARVTAQGGDLSGIMNETSLRRFIQHYERITRQLLIDMPARADWLFRLADDHRIIAAHNLYDVLNTHASS
jgi:D-glycerate 3-kinase